MKKENIIKKNIKFFLDESCLMDFKEVDNTLIFRFAIPCFVIDGFRDEKYFDYYYFYDCYCKNYANMETNYNNDVELYDIEVLSFDAQDDKYALFLYVDWDNIFYFKFDCDGIDWKPIKMIYLDDLEEGIDNDKFKFDDETFNI